MTKYWNDLLSSWVELETRFRRGEIEPQQENDVVCYLYHALVKRLEKEGRSLKIIRTEDWFPGIGRADLDIGERLVVEVRLVSRKTTYGSKSWAGLVRTFKQLAEKLQKYNNDINHSHTREPVLAVWNWKANQSGISSDLEEKLRRLRRYLSTKGVRLLYGPRSRS